MRNMGNDVPDLVLQAAYQDGQWKVVTELIHIGLTTAQQDMVCDEDLEGGLLLCVTTIICRDLGTDCVQNMMRHISKQIPWESLHAIFDQHNIQPPFRNIIRKYLTACVERKFRDCELSQAFISAIDNDNQLLAACLLSLGPGSTRRIFKQVAMKTEFSNQAAITKLLDYLVERDDLDLAFHLAVTQKRWSRVIAMYESQGVSSRSRRLALQHAVKSCAEDVVKKLAASKSTSDRERRHAFLQAFRLGDLFMAMYLSTADAPSQISQCTTLADSIFAVTMKI